MRTLRSSLNHDPQSLRAARYIALAVSVFGMLGAGCGGEEAGDPVADQSAPIVLNADFPETLYDGGAQCVVGGHQMHCCPNGDVMIGANVSREVFKCARPTTSLGPRFFISAFQANNMLSCPGTAVMSGMDVRHSYLSCQAYNKTRTDPAFIDPGTQDSYPMHVCAGASPSGTYDGYAMAGIDVSHNRFTCVD